MSEATILRFSQVSRLPLFMLGWPGFSSITMAIAKTTIDLKFTLAPVAQ